MITSISNQKVKKWLKYRQSKYRHQDQRFIVEDRHLIDEAYRTNLLETLVLLENTALPFPFKQVEFVNKEVMKKLSQQTSMSTMIGICVFPTIRKDSNRVLLLDNIQIPGNMGTILRSAYAFGFQKVLLSKDCVDIYNEKVIQASQGALFYLDIQTVDLALFLDTVDYPIYATGFENSVELKTVPPTKKMGIILGNEGSGVSKCLLKKATQIIQIKMQAFDSLNVAIAGAILMYHFQNE